MYSEGTYLENLTDMLIATISNGKNIHTYKKIIRERQYKRFKENSVRSTLSRLSKKGYVSNSNGCWSITKKGLKHKEEKHLLSFIPSPFKKDSPDAIILAFDIPERDRKMRHWLRNQIKIFGYKMLQQSLWIGPGALPKEFFDKLEDLKIRKNVKTFRIKST